MFPSPASLLRRLRSRQRRSKHFSQKICTPPTSLTGWGRVYPAQTVRSPESICQREEPSEWMALLFVSCEHYGSTDSSKYAGILRQQSWRSAAPAIVLSDRQNRLRYAQTLCFAQNCRTVEPQVHCGVRTPKRDAIRMDGISFWQAAPIKISAVFLVFSMVSAFWGKVFGACCFILLVAAVQPKKILWDLWNFVRSARFCQRSPL